MSEATIRTAIYNTVNGVTNAGKVYDKRRYANDWSAFLDLFKTTISNTTQVRGWMVSYRGFPTTEANRLTKTARRISRTHRFEITGVMAIDDSASSEKTFAALAEDVCDALDSNATLQAFAHISPATLTFDPSPFAGVLVHAAMITLDVTEFV